MAKQTREKESILEKLETYAKRVKDVEKEIKEAQRAAYTVGTEISELEEVSLKVNRQLQKKHPEVIHERSKVR